MTADFGRRRQARAELEAYALELARRKEPAAPPGDRGCLIVTLAQEAFALPLGSVREVLVRPPITPLPGTPPFVAGVLNMRGRIVGVLDLGSLIGLAEVGAGRRYVVVVSHEGIWAGLLAEHVEAVAWFRSGELGPAPSRNPAAAFLEGAFPRGGRLVGAVRLGAVLGHPQLAAFRPKVARGTP